ncbi:DUF3265 domain-containing protein [Vibrio europaeus]|uniref:DUF3265 domain-containing protein n=1 Tax=Vibrio europaeus TaxID=300876 RepID=A0AAE7DYT5_9VIBR|nr:DUF3265 domain-containing protein [Vibrio europaeus]MBE4436206.1 DUF3265 domain-containing protein [Vibrio parahaemolyticus]MDC5806222.1 DUF3265 domain-containing protein [Vibrio europaeus]MDC5812535.1 DUF3265 domain-containing protein [Vibrio europaeus]MDC5825651.1 DUF3265 domain-containing protein [Vibrio europaeus]MDC5831069.1 DUF3265 domain-containing protein [Vibrio europaeus]
MLWTNSTTLITNNLRVIRNAWQLHYALSLVIMVQCCSVSVALLTP